MPLMQRLLGLGRRPEQPEALYAALVEQTRRPAFYADYGVPDTLEGRFDLLVLHAVLLLRRLREDSLTRALAQDVFDVFFREMDRTLREMGVGDLGVPRRVRVMAEIFYGRAKAYDAVLDGGKGDALEECLARNVFAEAGEAAGVARLARYVQAAVAALAATPREALLAGRVAFPDPTEL